MAKFTKFKSSLRKVLRSQAFKITTTIACIILRIILTQHDYVEC